MKWLIFDLTGNCWWGLVSPTFWKQQQQQQQDLKFEANLASNNELQDSLGYTARSCVREK